MLCTLWQIKAICPINNDTEFDHWVKMFLFYPKQVACGRLQHYGEYQFLSLMAFTIHWLSFLASTSLGVTK